MCFLSLHYCYLGPTVLKPKYLNGNKSLLFYHTLKFGKMSAGSINFTIILYVIQGVST